MQFIFMLLQNFLINILEIMLILFDRPYISFSMWEIFPVIAPV